MKFTGNQITIHLDLTIVQLPDGRVTLSLAKNGDLPITSDGFGKYTLAEAEDGRSGVYLVVEYPKQVLPIDISNEQLARSQTR